MEYCPNEEITLPLIMDRYNQSEKENFSLSEKNVGIIIADVWGRQVTKFKKRMGNKKRYVCYRNLKLSAPANPLSDGGLNSFVPPHGWAKADCAQDSSGNLIFYKLTNLVIDSERKVIYVICTAEEEQIEVFGLRVFQEM